MFGLLLMVVNNTAILCLSDIHNSSDVEKIVTNRSSSFLSTMA